VTPITFWSFRCHGADRASRSGRNNCHGRREDWRPGNARVFILRKSHSHQKFLNSIGDISSLLWPVTVASSTLVFGPEPSRPQGCGNCG